MRDLVFLQTDMKQSIKEQEENLEETPCKDLMFDDIINDEDDIVLNIVRHVSDLESDDESNEDSTKNDGYTTPTTRIANSVNYDTASNMVQDSSSESDMENEVSSPETGSVADNVDPAPETTVNQRLVQAMRNLEPSYNPEVNRIAAIGRDAMVNEKANYLIDSQNSKINGK